MTRIYVDARTITDEPTGVGRYARSLLTALIPAVPEREFVVLRHSSNTHPLFVDAPENVRELPVNRPIDGLENVLFGHRALQAAVARGGPPDLYHSLFHILPAKLRSVLGDIPVVTTLHDFVWIDYPDASQPTFVRARTIEAFARVAIPRALRASDRVIAISEPTRRRARQYIDDAAMVTIPHGVDERFFETAPPPGDPFADLADPQCPCIVAVGNHKPYKNLGLLIDAFTRLIEDGVRARLVLIGDCERLAGQADVATAGEWITMTGRVDDEVMRRLLGNGRVFVLPSKVEGFGLPLLEAMAAGLPTLVADVEPLRSIAGEAGLRFPADDAGALARLLCRVLEDDALADRLASRGRQRAGEFRWSETARRTLKVYENLL